MGPKLEASSVQTSLGIIFFIHMGLLHSLGTIFDGSIGDLKAPTKGFPDSGVNVLLPLSTCMIAVLMVGRQGHET